MCMLLQQRSCNLHVPGDWSAGVFLGIAPELVQWTPPFAVVPFHGARFATHGTPLLLLPVVVSGKLHISHLQDDVMVFLKVVQNN